MENVFLTVLNMSITASWIIPAVLLIRLLLRRAPKKYSYALWSVVAFRLCCPFSFSAGFSLLSLLQAGKARTNASMTYVPQDIGLAAQPEVYLGSETVSEMVSASLPAATPAASVNPMQIWIFVGTVLWCAGMAALLVYSVVSWFLLKRRLRKATLLAENVWQSEGVCSPFILGVIRPKIYIPYHLDGGTLRYVLEHERFHLKHGDHIVKPLAFLVLTVHWFNPLCWLAFSLMGRDMEMRCDEAVLSKDGGRQVYGNALLSFAANRRFPSAGPLAFGEGGVKGRIKNVLRWKKPRVWVTVLAVVICLAALLACAANPTEPEAELPGELPPAGEEVEFDDNKDKLAVPVENLLPGEISYHPDPIILTGDSEMIYQINYTRMGMTVELGLVSEDGTEYFDSIRGGSGRSVIREIPAGTYQVFVRNSEENLQYAETAMEPLIVTGVMAFQYTGQPDSQPPVEEKAPAPEQPEQTGETHYSIALGAREDLSFTASGYALIQAGIEDAKLDSVQVVDMTEEIYAGLLAIFEGKEPSPFEEFPANESVMYVTMRNCTLYIDEMGFVSVSDHPFKGWLELSQDELDALYDLLRQDHAARMPPEQPE